jgi:hypothetical protein
MAMIRGSEGEEDAMFWEIWLAGKKHPKTDIERDDIVCN